MLMEALPTLDVSPPSERQKAARLAEHLQHRPGDLKWTLAMLSSFKEQAKIECPFFEPDYVAPPRHNRRAQDLDAADREHTNDADGFFKKLPPLSLTVLKKTRVRSLLTPRERQQQQIAKEKAQLAARQAKLSERERQLLSDGDDDDAELSYVRLGKRTYQQLLQASQSQQQSVPLERSGQREGALASAFSP